MASQTYERYMKVLLNGQGNIIEVPLRRGAGNTAFIDTISFTVFESYVEYRFNRSKGFPAFENSDLALEMSETLQSILGYGISGKAKHKGGRFFDECWELGADGVLYGSVHIGGNNGRLLVELNGTGCAAALDGWEQRLYCYLRKNTTEKVETGAKITRCDVARDFFKGEVTPDKAYRAWKRGKFDRHGKRPAVEKVGKDWESDTLNGKTLYVGTRNSGIYTRIYDKAKQFGDKSSDWTRAECQFQGSNIQIPLDMLLNPGEYWGGAYVYFEALQKGEAKRVKSTRKKLETTLSAYKSNMKRQYGKGINALLELGMSSEQIVEELRDEQGRLPERLKSAAYSIEFAGVQSNIHDSTERCIPYAEFF